MEELKAKDQQGLVAYIRLLRFGPAATQSPTRVYLPIRKIAKMVKLSQQHVRRLICEDPSRPANPPRTRPGPMPILTPEHVGYLTSPATL